MDDIFSAKKETDTYSKAEKLLEEVKEANITHGNFSQWYEKVKNVSEMISVTIENYTSEYTEVSEQIKNSEEKDNQIKEAEYNQMYPIYYVDLVKRKEKILQNITSWKFLDADLKTNLLQKSNIIMQTVKAFDIEREALTRTEKLVESMQNSFLKYLDIIVKQHNQNHKEILMAVKTDTRKELENFWQDEDIYERPKIRKQPESESEPEPEEVEVDIEKAFRKKESDEGE